MKNIRKTKRVVIAVIVMTLLVTASAWADVGSFSGQYIGPGTYYSSKKTVVGTKAQTINVIESIYGTNYIKIEGADSAGPIVNANVLNQANTKNTNSGGIVLGAVNGDFFDMTKIKGLTYGTSIINGEIRTGMESYSVFGVDSQNKPFIDKLTMDGKIQAGGQEYSITAVNRLRWKDQVIVYTPAFGTSTQTSTPGTEIVISGFEMPLKANTPVTGKVVSINVDAMNTAIPADGVVISIENGLVATALAALQVEDEVQIAVNFNISDVQHAIGGNPRLLTNGALSPEINTHSTALQRNPRTAVGIKNDRVVIVTVDGRRTGQASGMTLPEFADYLKAQGVQNAINLDGGGSTTMVARFQGKAAAVLANIPSDGGMRRVGNSIQIVSYAPLGEPTTIRSNEPSVKLFIGSTYAPNVYVMDQYFNKLPTPALQLTADGKVGVITENNLYQGKTVGSGSMDISSGAATVKQNITVVDAVSKLSINEGKQSLKTKDTKQFNVKATDQNGGKIYINSSSVKWKVEGNIGTIDANGKLQAGETAGTGKVIAYLSDTIKSEVEVEVKLAQSVPKDPVIIPPTTTPPVTPPGTVDKDVIEGFDLLDNLTISAVRTEVTASVESEPTAIKSGSGALKVEYNMKNGEEGTAAVYIKLNKPVDIPENAKSIGMWAYGDGSSNWLRAYYTDGAGERKTMNFTAIDGFNWTGWQYVVANLPENELRPVKLEQIYFAQPENQLKGAGTVFFDELKVLYE